MLHVLLQALTVRVVAQLLRETIGIHTCDQRSSKTYIEAEFPSAVFEAGFVEDDPFWKPDERESYSALDARIKMLLDDVFTNDGHTFISFTSHSGTTNSILRGKCSDPVEHPPFFCLILRHVSSQSSATVRFRWYPEP